MPDLVAAGSIQGGGTVPGREPAFVSEPGDVTDVAEEPGRAGRADAVHLQQAAAGRGHQLLELGIGGLDALAGEREPGDQLGGEPAAGLARDVTRADRGQEFLRLRGGQELLRPAREQFQQQPVQPVHRLRAGCAQLIPAISQQPQRHRRVIGADDTQAGAVQPGQRHRMRIDRVSLASLASGEDPGPGGQFRGHIDDRFAIGDQALGDVAADAVAPFHRTDLEEWAKAAVGGEATLCPTCFGR